MPASSASRSIESSSSERSASRRTPRSSSCSRRSAGLSRVRVVVLTRRILLTLVQYRQYRRGMTEAAPAKRVDHLIIGAGFAGLCAAIKLQEDGERDFVVVERGPDV